MIVDDDTLVRVGLSDLLDADEEIDVVAQATDGLHAVELATAHHIDVALVDIRMPRMDGITAISRLRALPHPPRVITLTTFDLHEYVYNALAADADGFLLKDVDPAEILRAVRLVAAGSAMPPPAVSSTATTTRIDLRPPMHKPASTAPPGNKTFWLCSPKDRPTLTSHSGSACGRAPSKLASAASSPDST